MMVRRVSREETAFCQHLRKLAQLEFGSRQISACYNVKMDITASNRNFPYQPYWKLVMRIHTAVCHPLKDNDVDVCGDMQ